MWPSMRAYWSSVTRSIKKRSWLTTRSVRGRESTDLPGRQACPYPGRCLARLVPARLALPEGRAEALNVYAVLRG